ncbi:polysaccharide biosynthesis/export family protein [Paraburkholderia sabiae]|uniref:Polysaccharide biosynthesis/export family protein n=2 Tax=Paraburkholderia sabiae TaxID=273251 RepID=A0ABU9QT92_9BURK
MFPSVAAVLTATGCTTVPGLQMPSAATQPTYKNAAPPPVAIQEIDAGLVEAQQTVRTDAERVVVQQLLGGGPSGYRIGRGDVLQIVVWDHPEFALGQGTQPATQPRQADAPAGTIVDDAGNIQFPFVGQLRVEGLSTDAVKGLLSKRLAEYFNSPQVTVRIASFRSKQVFVDGEVHAPGVQQINDIPMTIMDAISRSGGFTADADQGRVLLTRGGQRYIVSISGLVAAGYDPSALFLRNRDLLRVPTRSESGVYVMGEVAKPMTALPKPDGSLTLADALSQSGSFNLATSDPRQLYVVRRNTETKPAVFHLDARSPVAMVMAGQFGLKPGDVVYVGPTDLTIAYRVLSQLLPAIGAGLTGAVVAK